jgi:Phage integrase, N-terminal/Integrase
VRDLNFGLKKLVHQRKEGSFATRAARNHILQQAANTLHELGYRKLKPTGVKPKHVEALVEHWQAQSLSPGTIKNRLVHLRWWAEQVGKASVVARSNDHYSIDRRLYVSGEDKSRQIDEERLAKVTDHHTRMSLRLQQAFGLRREEAIKFSPSYADRGDKLVLKASWTKGGKAREIPVRNEDQRRLLDEIRQFAGRGSLIPANKNYYQQMRTYERNTQKAELNKNHGLRHAYAHSRYEELTGWKCPAQGGPARRALTPDRRETDRSARQTISRELGHERPAIVSVYCG